MPLCATACAVVVPSQNNSDIVGYSNLHAHKALPLLEIVSVGNVCVCVASSTFAAQRESHSRTALIKKRSNGAIELLSKTF